MVNSMSDLIGRLFPIAIFFCASPSFAGTLAQFRTPLGNVDVELFSEDKQVTVENFLRYVDSGAYTKMFLHRWVPGFVVQGGGYFVTTVTNKTVIEVIPHATSIVNEFSVGRKFSNTYGTLAMARVSGQTNSANSEWFFNLANNSDLDSVDGGFTVFGRVLGGTNLLERFNNISQTNGIFILQSNPPLDELPVLSATPSFQDLIYVDISPWRVHVEPDPKLGAAISWLSISNRPNHIEFTESLPPQWQTLLTTNGTGASFRYVDSGALDRNRFYRVRVDY